MWKNHFSERKRICSYPVPDDENIIQIQKAVFDTCHSIGENHPVNTDRTEDPQRELTRIRAAYCLAFEVLNITHVIENVKDVYWKNHYSERKRICSNPVTGNENIIQIRKAVFDTCHSIGGNHPVKTNRTEDPQRDLTRVYFTKFRSLYSYGRQYIGAGSHSSNLHNEYKRLCNKACRKGVQVMKEGGTAMEAIQAAVIILENDPLTNCGFGSNLTLEGMVENDASVMNGKTLAFGGCGAVKKIKNPIALAYDICVKQSVGLPLGLIPPSLLVGSGALKHAKHSGLKVVPNSSLVCKRASRQFKKYKALLDVHQENCERLDTVGAVCIDGKGDVAAACSSGGLILKKPGRVGQAALYASGTWADSLDKSTEPSVAVCTTGCGEYLIQTHLAKELAEDLKFNPNAMAFHKAMGVKFLKSKFLRNVNRKLGGALVVHRDNKSGEVSVLWGHTTDSMGVGYMHTKDAKPKSFICELPGYAVPGESINVGGAHFFSDENPSIITN